MDGTPTSPTGTIFSTPVGLEYHDIPPGDQDRRIHNSSIRSEER
jgi:hypothetical protein